MVPWLAELTDVEVAAVVDVDVDELLRTTKADEDAVAPVVVVVVVGAVVASVVVLELDAVGEGVGTNMCVASTADKPGKRPVDCRCCSSEPSKTARAMALRVGCDVSNNTGRNQSLANLR